MVNVYEFPKMNLLNPPVIVEKDTEWLQSRRAFKSNLDKTLMSVQVLLMSHKVQLLLGLKSSLSQGVKVNKITNLSDDIKLSLAAKDIRIEAPIPGKHTIGIEVPNQKSRPVLISEIIQSPVFRESASPLTAVLGLDISGKPIVTDLKKNATWVNCWGNRFWEKCMY